MLVAWYIFFDLKIDAKRSSETSVDFYQTTRCHLPEDRPNSLHSHRCENFKPTDGNVNNYRMYRKWRGRGSPACHITCSLWTQGINYPHDVLFFNLLSNVSKIVYIIIITRAVNDIYLCDVVCKCFGYLYPCRLQGLYWVDKLLEFSLTSTARTTSI
jgi:hypothetical protein